MSALDIAARVERFVRDCIVPHERDPRWGAHGPSEAMVVDMRDKARAAGLLTPHIDEAGHHRSHRDTAAILRAAGLSPLGPVALNVAAPDEVRSQEKCCCKPIIQAMPCYRT